MCKYISTNHYYLSYSYSRGVRARVKYLPSLEESIQLAKLVPGEQEADDEDEEENSIESNCSSEEEVSCQQDILLCD